MINETSLKIDSLKKTWIENGYALFATQGPTAVKVEVLARKVKKSKSSFYHHFVDVELFTNALLVHHLERAKCIAEQEKKCKTVVPDLLNLLLEIKQDLLFNRQLRINRENAAFKKCFEKAGQLVANAILQIWAEMLGLTEKTYLADIVLKMTIENFYLQITAETLTYNWLLNYVNEIRFMVSEMQKKETAP